MLITKYKDSTNLIEEYQQTGIYFAFISAPKDGYKQCHQLVKCRDFLHDAVRCSIPNNEISKCKIYNFEYINKVNPSIDLNKMRLMVTYKDTKDNFLNINNMSIEMLYALKLIHHYEKMMGIKIKTRQKQFNHKDFINPIWTFTGNSIWVRSPVLISLYTFLIRLGNKKINFNNDDELQKAYKQLIKNDENKDDYIVDKDIHYLKTIYSKLNIFLKNYKNLLFINNKFDTLFLDSKIDIQSFHNNSGILSLINGTIWNKSVKKNIKNLLSRKLN